MNPLFLVIGVAACLFFSRDFEEYMEEHNSEFKNKKEEEARKVKEALKADALAIKSKDEIVLRGQFPQERKDKPVEYAFGAKRFDLDDLYMLKSYTEDGITVYPIVELSGSLHPIYIDEKDYTLLKEIQSFNS
jgi:hypothetical protein